MIGLLVLMVLTVCGNAQQDSTPPPDSTIDTKAVAADSVEADTTELVHKTIVYYFHGTRRCSNCIKIENYTKEAIDSAYADLLESGRMEFRIVNTDEEENRHFMEDYQLYTKSVVLVNQVNGEQVRWKNLPEIWQLLGKKDEFIKYVRKETKFFLEDV
jgi:hypothetical protein